MSLADTCGPWVMDPQASRGKPAFDGKHEEDQTRLIHYSSS